MEYERINAALRDATDTQNVTIGTGVLASVDEIFRQSFGDQPAVVVAVGNTFEIAGKEVLLHLQAAGQTLLEPYIFPGQPTLAADYRNIVPLRDALRSHDAIPVAVGAGVLNDIVKRAASECERSYEEGNIYVTDLANKLQKFRQH